VNWIKQNWFKITIVLIIGVVSFYILKEDIDAKKQETKFCKEQCNYIPEKRSWEIDLGWVFQKYGVKTEAETKKVFSEKDLDECINYCKALGDHLNNLLFGPDDWPY